MPAILTSFRSLFAVAAATLVAAWAGLTLKGVAIIGAPIAGLGLTLLLVYLMRRYAKRGETTLAAALGATAFLIIFTLGGGLLSYLMMSRPAPFLDAQFAAIDAAFGLDWIATLRFVNDRPWLVLLLSAAYHVELVMVAVTVLLMLVAQRADRVIEFCWLFALTGLATVIISGLLPAAGAYVHYAPPIDARDLIAPDSGVWHLKQLLALRSGEMRVINLARMEGLVTFPSFHTALALALAVSLRGVRYVFAPMAIYAAAVVISTVPIGGHYFIDTIGGALILLAALPIAQRLSQPRAAGAAARPIAV